MSKGLSRADRLAEMRRLYHQRAYTDVEMARRLGVDRTTAYKDRVLLERDAPFILDDDGRYRIDRTKYVSEVRLNVREALSLYLPARRASQQAPSGQQAMASALEKLALALRQPMTERLVKAADLVLAQKARAERDQVFEAVANAWVGQNRLHVRYLGLRSQRPYNDVVNPYLVEPSPWSDSVYLIGASQVFNDIVSYKLDRIESAHVSSESFQLPDDFDEQALLRYAWGVWRGDDQPVLVTLRFAPGPAARRLKESVWHPLESVTDSDDGGCLWQAPIAEWREMLPWIRGWGADVEVLEPTELRQALMQATRKLAEVYRIVETARAQPKYYAHSRPDLDESEWQPLIEHLTATSELASQNGYASGISELARIAGLLHDIGKYSEEFQARLRGSNQRVDHATAGAREIVKLFPDPPHNALAELISYCIAGHHTGLPDYGSMGDMGNDGTLLARRVKKVLKDYSAYQTEIKTDALTIQPLRIVPSQFRFGEKEKANPGFAVSFLTRMLFSALVDADWLETERYMDDAEKPRGQYATIGALTEQFNGYLRRFDDSESPINRKRTETLRNCLEKASENPGYFTLTVPTGGGKTLASMAFALNHANTHGLERIIYVIPFTSIIEQNAAVFRDALGDLGPENILEHHSNYDWERRPSDDESNQVQDKLKLAAENWDIPIVVTTNVQFFESLFASKKSQARKLHNIAKSVIIFDEVQMLPRHYLKPCLLAVQELVENYGCSTVFCTATQPSLQRFFPGKTQFTELASNPQALFDFYRRVQVRNLGTLPDEELLEKLRAHNQALCIVNTRRHAKGLYDGLVGSGSFHLSTLMCPTHRTTTLNEIRKRLKTGQPCRVVSTQVMEAGIDVDFPVGFRALAGLDSIIQAAGRVNREMRQSSSNMFVFNPQTEFIKRTPEFIKQTASVAESILRDHASDPTTIDAIEAYYALLYTLHDERSFDTQAIVGHFEKGTRRPDFDFKTAADKFKLIDQNTVTVYIPYDEEAKRLIASLQYAPYPTKILRRLQLYAVNIYQQEFETLQSNGAIQTIADAYHALDSKQMDIYYHPQTGLAIPERSYGNAVFYD